MYINLIRFISFIVVAFFWYIALVITELGFEALGSSYTGGNQEIIALASHSYVEDYCEATFYWTYS